MPFPGPSPGQHRRAPAWSSRAPEAAPADPHPPSKGTCQNPGAPSLLFSFTISTLGLTYSPWQEALLQGTPQSPSLMGCALTKGTFMYHVVRFFQRETQQRQECDRGRGRSMEAPLSIGGVCKDQDAGPLPVHLKGAVCRIEAVREEAHNRSVHSRRPVRHCAASKDAYS